MTKGEAEKARLLAEAALFESQARQAYAEAEVAEIELERKRHEELKRLAGDEYHRVYRFTNAVAEGSVASCMNQLAIWRRTDPGCPIEIVFSSPGGSVIPGMALFDYIRSMSDADHEMTTYALGYAASMAGILLQAGDHRVIGPEAWLLIHRGSAMIGGDMGKIDDYTEWFKAIDKRILNIFYERSRAGDKPLSRHTLAMKYDRKDWWISSDDALKWGFVDEVR